MAQGAQGVIELVGDLQHPLHGQKVYAPPVDRMDFTALAAPSCPWLVVHGDSDEVVDPQRVIAWAKSCTPQPQLVIMPGVGHFFHGHLPLLRDAVIDAIRSG